tara:strand:- start:1269 stop:1862 length:594 start_codon:yes stop_codon:yes gene_type:complete
MAKETKSRMGTILIILVLIGLGVLLYFLYNQSIKNNTEEEYLENFEDHSSPSASPDDVLDEESGMDSFENHNEMESFENHNEMESFQNQNNMNGNQVEQRNNSAFPKQQLGASDLLPQDDSSLWAQVNPSGEGSLKDRNFLQSGYHIGINTVGQTLRNANQQLRSEPPNPQVKVSPWLQTTIEPDLGRKPMEIGGCA